MRLLSAMLVFAAFGCSDSAGVMRLATTTSVRDSGLLEELLPRFEEAHNCRVDVVAVGTGAALKLGEAGDVDVVLVHARDAEDGFMGAGHGIRHEEFMQNEFLLLGPASDPAGVRGKTPSDAFRAIAAGGHKFLSRGDESGTHQREISLWKAAGGLVPWEKYIESGQGMGATLVMADELEAYVLTDRGTSLNFRERIELEPLVADSPELRNPYAVMIVNPETHQRVNAELAEAFVEFLLTPETQQAIGAYRIGGEKLFQPTRLPK